MNLPYISKLTKTLIIDTPVDTVYFPDETLFSKYTTLTELETAVLIVVWCYFGGRDNIANRPKEMAPIDTVYQLCLNEEMDISRAFYANYEKEFADRLGSQEHLEALAKFVTKHQEWTAFVTAVRCNIGCIKTYR